MIIRSLKLQNYRKFKDTFIEFPDGLFGVVGNNGAGKTTIIEAVAWCIYGRNASKTDPELIKREQADPDSDCRAELEFSLGSDSYRVVRELRGRRQSPYASVYVNNSSQPEVEGIHPVTRHLSNKIGMDYASFFTSVFAKQKELDALSDLTVGERKKRILRLLRIDRIDVAIGNVRQDRKESETKIGAIKGTLQDIDELNSKLDTIKKQKVKDKDAVKAERVAVREAKVHLAKAKKIRDALERKYQRYQKLTQQLKVHDTKKGLNAKNVKTQEGELEKLELAKNELVKIRPRLKAFRSVKLKKEKLDGLREKYVKKVGFEKQLSETNQKISSLKEDRKSIVFTIRKAKNLDSKLKAVEKRIEVYNRQSGGLGKRIAGKSVLIKEYRQQRRELTIEFEKIKKLGPKSKCPLCNKVIGKDFPDIITHFKKEIAKIGGKIQSQEDLIRKLSAQFEKANKFLKEAKARKDSIDKLIKQRAKDEQKRDSLDIQIESEVKQRTSILKNIKDIGFVKYDEEEHRKVKGLFDSLTKLDKRRIVLKEQVLRITSVKRSIKGLKTSLTSIAKQMGKVSNSITKLGFNEAEYEKVKKDYTVADTHYHKKREQMIYARNKLVNTLKEITVTIKQITEEKRKRRQIEKEEKKIEILNSLDKIFGDFRVELISRIRPLLSLRSSELFRKVTDGKYPNISLDENYGMLIEDAGKQFPLERFSGGEEDLASLCLRIAISQVMEERAGVVGINFIVLDEIFGSQDEARKNNILKALNDLSSQFRQIVVITHVEDVKDLLPYVFNVVEMVDKSSKIIAEGSPSMALTG